MLKDFEIRFWITFGGEGCHSVFCVSNTLKDLDIVRRGALLGGFTENRLELLMAHRKEVAAWLVEKMLNLGYICRYCVHLNMHRKLTHTTCDQKMANRKVATALHCSGFYLVPTILGEMPIFLRHHHQKFIPKLMCHFPKFSASLFKIQSSVEFNFHF